MPGFLITNYEESNPFLLSDNETMQYDFLDADDFSAYRKTLNKFMDDKLFLDTENYFCVIEGVLLNKREMFEEYNVNNLQQLLNSLIESKEDLFFSRFRGPFSGAIYKKAIKEWMIFTNQTGEKPVFYYHNKTTNKYILGSEVSYILQIVKQNKVDLSLDESAVYDMLTFAFMERDETYANEIKRLTAGHYIKFDRGEFCVKKYHSFNHSHYNTENLDKLSILENVDDLFRKAVKREFDKDVEYGYRHFSDLSGGLDSRMTTWVAAEMGYKNMTHLIYSQTNSDDEKIAKQISDFWNHDIWFRSLNSAVFMYDIDETIRENAGLSIYCGITGGRRCLRELNLEEFGLEHTGQIGDAILGTFFRKDKDIKSWNYTGMYSEKLLNKIDDKYKYTFDENELYLLYTRCLQGAANTHMIRQNYIEVTSPFMDVDFLEYCMSISPNIRLQHSLYIDWINTKYPGAARYKWEKHGFAPADSKTTKFLRKVIKYGPSKIKTKLRIKTKLSKKGMNPLDYWYANNKEMRIYLDGYFESHINMELISNDLKKTLCKHYYEGTTIEKAQCLTVLAAIKFYFFKDGINDKYDCKID